MNLPVNPPAVTRPQSSWRGFFLKLAFMILLLVLLLELMLRVQQAIGPYYDVVMNEIGPDIISDEINHGPHRDGIFYDEHGIRIYPGIHPAKNQYPKILFMGDSFMQGDKGETKSPTKGIALTIHAEYQKAGKSIHPWNAGFSSYSPSIFIVQFRKLISSLKPDYVLVDIDHTDMADDAYRYEPLTERDSQGAIQRVRVTPSNRFHTEALLSAREHNLFLMRFMHKVYSTQWQFRQQFKQRADEVNTKVAEFVNKSPDEVQGKFETERSLFERNLRNLADVMIAGLGSGKKIIWCCHPHPHHFTDVPGQPRHHRLVFDCVQKVAKDKSINFYEATADLQKLIGKDYESYYLKDDPIWHFSGKGTQLYGQCIYRNLPSEWK